MRIILAHITKRIYPMQVQQLHVRLDEEKELLNKLDNVDFRLLSKLLISGEDHRFKYHPGFDVWAMLRALKNRILYRRNEGASTIEQQLVRVLTDDYDRNFRRKFKEILLATTLTENIDREKLPEIYLSIAYYGTNQHGLLQALSSLKIEPEQISLEDAAEIVSRIKYPEPKVKNTNRERQIQMRKAHLINLYNKHSKKKILKIYG